MIRGVGIDLIEIERVRRVLARRGERFLRRVFAAGEIAEARAGGDFAASLAARFAAKEAAYKALRDATGEPLPLRSIVVSRPRGRAPTIVLAGSASGRGAGVVCRLSLTHGGGLACAVVVAEDSRDSKDEGRITAAV